MVAGFPLAGLLGNDIVVTTGIVNSLAGIGNDPGQIQVSAPVQPGNSGGPLLDKSGNLGGLVVSKLIALRTAAGGIGGDIAQNVNFAIKPEVVRLFLDVNGLTMRAADPGVRLETEDLAVRARDVTVVIEEMHRRCDRAPRWGRVEIRRADPRSQRQANLGLLVVGYGRPCRAGRPRGTETGWRRWARRSRSSPPACAAPVRATVGGGFEHRRIAAHEFSHRNAVDGVHFVGVGNELAIAAGPDHHRRHDESRSG